MVMMPLIIKGDKMCKCGKTHSVGTISSRPISIMPSPTVIHSVETVFNTPAENKELKELFSIRDSLTILVNSGYFMLQDALDNVNKEINEIAIR